MFVYSFYSGVYSVYTGCNVYPSPYSRLFCQYCLWWTNSLTKATVSLWGRSFAIFPPAAAASILNLGFIAVQCTQFSFLQCTQFNFVQCTQFYLVQCTQLTFVQCTQFTFVQCTQLNFAPMQYGELRCSVLHLIDLYWIALYATALNCTALNVTACHFTLYWTALNITVHHFTL